MWVSLLDWFLGNLAWQLSTAAVIAVSSLTIANKGLGLLPTKSNALWFVGGVFVLTSFVLTTLYGKRLASPYQLYAEINESIHGGRADNGDKSTLQVSDRIFFILSVYNTGTMPTVLRNLEVEVMIAGATYHGHPFRYTDEVSFELGNGHSMTYEPSDNFIDKMSIPIPVGGEVVGLVAVKVPDVPPIALSDSSLKTEASVWDVRGNVYHTSTTTTMMTGPVFVPGLNPTVQ